MSRNPERDRLHRSDILKLAGIVQQLLGSDFSVESRDKGTYIGIFDKNKAFVASYQWVQDVGWRASIAQPVTFCPDDVVHMVDELRQCLQGAIETGVRWEDFQNAKSDKTWGAYQGARAAHAFRMYRPDAAPLEQVKAGMPLHGGVVTPGFMGVYDPNEFDPEIDPVEEAFDDGVPHPPAIVHYPVKDPGPMDYKVEPGPLDYDLGDDFLDDILKDIE